MLDPYRLADGRTVDRLADTETKHALAARVAALEDGLRQARADMTMLSAALGRIVDAPWHLADGQLVVNGQDFATLMGHRRLVKSVRARLREFYLCLVC